MLEKSAAATPVTSCAARTFSFAVIRNADDLGRQQGAQLLTVRVGMAEITKHIAAIADDFHIVAHVKCLCRMPHHSGSPSHFSGKPMCRIEIPGAAGRVATRSARRVGQLVVGLI